jgi:hypothetical protein
VAILFSDEECCPVAPDGPAVGSSAAGNTAETSGSSQSMAVSVTRHAQNPPVAEFQFLLSGIDTLDLGLYVIWGSDWKRRLRSLDQRKQKARTQKDGLLVGLPSGRACIFKPGGKGENYRFHLQFEAYNLYIGKAARPGESPNVYLSIRDGLGSLDNR